LWWQLRRRAGHRSLGGRNVARVDSDAWSASPPRGGRGTGSGFASRMDSALCLLRVWKPIPGWEENYPEPTLCSAVDQGQSPRWLRWGPSAHSCDDGATVQFSRLRLVVRLFGERLPANFLLVSLGRSRSRLDLRGRCFSGHTKRRARQVERERGSRYRLRHLSYSRLSRMGWYWHWKFPASIEVEAVA
jgi:hypothetical protein